MHLSYIELYQSWLDFRRNKSSKTDVLEFESNLADNLAKLYQKINNNQYQHGHYKQFQISDPKPRLISKASVQDRIVHHSISRKLEKIFEKSFIFDSYSSRQNKGLHKSIVRLKKFSRKVSQNHRFTFWALKIDIHKFFDSVDHGILLNLVRAKVPILESFGIYQQIIKSFCSNLGDGKGIPLGNLTSQISANIYLNQLDQYAKQNLRIKYYLRYSDDLLILHRSKTQLLWWLSRIENYLYDSLKLTINRPKIRIRKNTHGIDWLGYFIYPKHILPRSATRRRIYRQFNQKNHDININLKQLRRTLVSYYGYLSHTQDTKTFARLKKIYYQSYLLYHKYKAQ